MVQSISLIIRSNLVSTALKSDQTGSAMDFSSVLSLLTSMFPEIWEIVPSIKKAPISQLSKYLERGSQGGPPQVWDNIATIIQHLPQELLANNVKQAQNLLEAMHAGFLRKDEPRSNLQRAWICYISVAQKLEMLMASEEDRCNLLKETLLPIFDQHVRSTQDPRWSIGPNGLRVCATVFNNIIKQSRGLVREALETEWQRLATIIIDDMRISLPEQSKDYHSSQMHVAGEGHRLATLHAQILETSDDLSSARPLLRDTSISIVKNGLQVLQSRSGTYVVAPTFRD